MGLLRRGTRRAGKDPAGQEQELPAEPMDQDVAEGIGEPGDDESDRVNPLGPYDSSVAPHREDRLDLGSLWVSGVEDMQVRLDLDQETGAVTSATFSLGDSAMQVQAFAAPKSSGIWAEIREEIAGSVTEQGGTVQDTTGPWGPELRVRLPGHGPDGRPGLQSVRFLGVDGPRWFFRAVLTGPAASSDAATEPLLDVVRSTVVVRGSEAMPPRELLPLRLPGESDVEDTPSDAPPRLEALQRGPEITEIR